MLLRPLLLLEAIAQAKPSPGATSSSFFPSPCHQPPLHPHRCRPPCHCRRRAPHPHHQPSSHPDGQHGHRLRDHLLPSLPRPSHLGPEPFAAAPPLHHGLLSIATTKLPVATCRRLDSPALPLCQLRPAASAMAQKHFWYIMVTEFIRKRTVYHCSISPESIPRVSYLFYPVGRSCRENSTNNLYITCDNHILSRG
uniref:Uncharacterized protein n=1 Tax=Oryza sativa subsp. japonica TaxID=39947 RepID=Q84ZA2_ORYSJ|nr:unknown protein [Oryza sativa Japonica Group]BAD10324.1 unknown protein [Oryza sativa Japonica Group]